MSHSPESDSKETLPYKTRKPSVPPLPPSKWPDNPILICVNPLHNSYHKTPNNNNSIPINKPFPMETTLFKGKAICRALGFKNTEKWYFNKKNRKMSFTLQGEFKKKIRFDRLFTGQMFTQKFRNIPGRILINAGLRILKALAPQMIADIDSDTPHLMSPLCSALQTFNIQKKNTKGEIINELPSITKEDISLLDNKYKNLNWQSRKKLFNNKEILKKYYFEPGYIYTLETYTHMIYAPKYKACIGGMQFNINNYITDPLQINVLILPNKKQKKTKKYNIFNENDNNNTKIDWNVDNINLNKCHYLYNLQLWHTSLLNNNNN